MDGRSSKVCSHLFLGSGLAEDLPQDRSNPEVFPGKCVEDSLVFEDLFEDWLTPTFLIVLKPKLGEEQRHKEFIILSYPVCSCEFLMILEVASKFH